MAVATNSVAVTGPMANHCTAITPWQVNATSAAAADCELIVAAPGTGYVLVVTRLVIYIGAAITVTIGSGKSGTAVEAVVIGPLGGAAGTYPLDCRARPIVLTTNKSLSFDASGSGAVCIYAEGFTKLA